MQYISESLKNLNKSDFFQYVNMHIHTNLSDGVLSPQEVIDEAKKIGLKIISITDHNSVEAYKNIDYSNTANLKVIPGVEFDCWYGSTLVHILGYGIDINSPYIKKFCAKNLNDTRMDFVRFFNTRKAKDVIKAIKSAGGIAVLAHPACCWSLNLKRMIKNLQNLGLDGVEVYYPYVSHRGIIKFYSSKDIRGIAEELNLIMTGGADSHGRNLRGR